MVISLLVRFAIVGAAMIGCILARVTPPDWRWGGLILLLACLAAFREYRILRVKARTVRSGDAFASPSAGWFAGSPASARDFRSRIFSPWDFEQLPSTPRQVAGGAGSAVCPPGFARQSLEQITREMLTMAFCRTSPVHHPDYADDPEISGSDMRQVYATQYTMLRTNRKA